MPRKKQSKTVVVTVDDEHMPKIAEVARRLRSKGLHVEEVMEATGMITGSYAKAPSSLESVRGVSSVEEQTQFQLPPPDSPIQ